MAIGSPQWMYASGEAYELDQSLKLDSASVANLQFTPSSASNRKTWTLSFWCKVGDINHGGQYILSGGNGCTDRIGVNFDNDMHLAVNVCGLGDMSETKAVFRDPSAWYHFVVAVDTTQSSSSDRIKFYVNGSLAEKTDNVALTLNKDYQINSTDLHSIGALSNAVNSASYTFGGYLGEMHFIDGQTLTGADFGETGTYDKWKPIEYSGTYGTNGFYLNFAGGGVMSATGGNSTVTDGDYKAASFTSNGTFTPSADGYVEYLIIGGGGGGGRGAEYNSVNAGGGAGGYLTGFYQVTKDTDYAIVVGDGGAGSTYSNISAPWGVIGDNGENSTAFGLTAVGGGLGGSYNSKGSDGGSGGGTGLRSSGSDLTGGAATAGQGNAGGSGTLYGGTGTANSGGGGGGAGGVGGNGSGGTGGSGGAGLASSITGSSVTRAGGGGGGARSNGGSGGSGGGGAGAGGSGAGGDGTANTGSGGGGGASSHPDSNVNNHGGGDGGSGIVIIRYKFQ
jgi:hypothetical protein